MVHHTRCQWNGYAEERNQNNAKAYVIDMVARK